MKTSTKLFWCGILTVLLSGGQVIAAVQVEAQVDQSRPIYAGSRFSYKIVVTDGDTPEGIDLAPLEPYHPSGPSTQSSTTMINMNVTRTQSLVYQLLALGEGEYTIPSVQVKVQGKLYRTNPVAFKVVKPGSAKQIDAKLEFSTQKSYVGQPVIMTLSFYVWTDVVRAKQIANIDIGAPFLEDEAFIKEDIAADPAKSTKTVLSVNGRDEYVYQDQVEHDGVDCVRIRFIKVLIPQKQGQFELKPAFVSADLAVAQKRNRNRDPFFSDFFGSQYEFNRFSTQTDSIQLEVEALPQTDVPADFYGLVGDYTITAEVDPKEVNVGDPITLTIEIGGSRYLKAVQWPELKKIENMTENFRIPDEYSDGEIRGGVKVFTQTIRANSEKVTEIPPIPLSFFEAKSGKYRTVKTKPIPLKVSATRIVTGADVESRQPASAAKQLEAVREGLSANYTSSDALINEQFSLLAALGGPVFLGLWGFPFVLLLASGIGRAFLVNTPKRQAASRCKNALPNAIRLIQTAGKHAQPSQQVSLALKQYIAHKFGKLAGSLTADDCRNILFERTGDVEVSESFHKIMGQIDASEYSPIAFELTDQKRNEIIQLLKEIEKKIR